MAGRSKLLERIIRDTLWMACRYAHGRQTYAVGMYNNAARLARELGVVSERDGDPLFALDRDMTPGMSGLSQDEFDAAYAIWSSPEAVPNHARISRGSR